ncbi:MAG TPA: ABC transporter permease, partial [Bryobacteraceae bacterium]|nr:ABC transporter permease [Bryobacteraceae bacterium]
SDNYFDALGLRPERGAFFQSSRESLPAVVSHALWRNVFASRDDAVGSGVRVRGVAFTVTAVAPAGFGGLDLERRADVWVPARAWSAWRANSGSRYAPAQIVVRLRNAVELAQAEAEVRGLYPAMVDAGAAEATGLTAADIARQKQRRVLLASAGRGVSAIRKQLSKAMPALIGAMAALLLLIAVSVGGIMLARGEMRRADIALRLSIGASRWHVLRAMLSESATLTGAGALLAWLIAQGGGPLLTEFLPSRRPLNIDLHPNLRVLAFTAAVTAAVALLASIAPALSALRTDLMQVLGKGASRTTAPVSGRGIVIVQVALAAMLVAASISLARSLAALRQQDPGFERERLIVAVLDPRTAGAARQQLPSLYAEVLRRAGELTGTADASMGGAPLMRGVGFRNTMGRAGSPLTEADRLNVSLNYASDTHFRNLGVDLISGRNVTRGDLEMHPTPVVVTESLAKEFFPGVDPLGREFGPAGPDGFARPEYRVAGVVRDVKYRGMREMAPPTFFAAFRGTEEMVTLHVRTRIHEGEMMRQIRAMLASIGPGLTPISMATMEQEIETSLWQERMLSFLSQVFAIVAALIAAMGLFGLITFTLARRTREVGIRVAVGATPGRIVQLFAGYASGAVVPGILLGLGAFAVGRRGLDPLLFGSGAGSVAPMTGAALALTFVTVIAVAVPVIRAARILPAVALRDQ